MDMIAQEHSHARPRILVADDETVIALQIGELVEAEGYELTGVAGTAQEMVEMARTLRPDLVLMDIVMPGAPAGGKAGSGPEGPMDGIDACRIIQRDLNIPVVLLTAHGEEQFLRRARTALPSAYLLKPCQNTQIRAAIEVALALNAQSGPAAGFRLREAHHRIKNSFSLLHSMLRIQEMTTSDPAARHALSDAGARVLAMAAAHEAMSKSNLDAGCNARESVESLARTLFAAEAPPPPHPSIALELDLEEVALFPAQAVPCGIFLAEALTNAIKHAFPENRGGVIRICLRAEDGFALLSVSDDGRGLAGDMAELGRATFGLQCLKAAAEQLEGELRVDAENGRGVRFRLRFPLCSGGYQSRSA
jgi:two-component sensor histidine kinase